MPWGRPDGSTGSTGDEWKNVPDEEPDAGGDSDLMRLPVGRGVVQSILGPGRRHSGMGRKERVLLFGPVLAASVWVLASPPHLLGNNAFLQDDWFYYVRIGLNV